MSASIKSSSCSELGRSAQTSAPAQAVRALEATENTHASSQVESVHAFGTEQLIQAPILGNSCEAISSGNSIQRSSQRATRIYASMHGQAIKLNQPCEANALDGSIRGFFTPEKFGPLPPPIDPHNRPPVDFSRGLRRHNLPTREETSWFAKELPVIDRSKYLQFYATQMFSDVFLDKFLKIDRKACGKVDPYFCPETKMLMYPRTVFLLEVSKQPHLPHMIGAHGLMIQQEVPVPTTKTMPLFVGETGSVTCWWYAGEFQVDDGELLAPVTKKHREIMRGLAERFAEWSIEKEKEGGEWNHITRAQWKNAMYDRMLSKDGQRPKIPYYIRRLEFKEFHRQFYKDLCWINRMFMKRDTCLQDYSRLMRKY